MPFDEIYFIALWWNLFFMTFPCSLNNSCKRSSSLTKLKLDIFKPKYIQTPNFNSMSRKAAERNLGNWNLARPITPVKVGQAWRNQTLSSSCHDKFMYQISSQYLQRRQKKVKKTKFQQRAITPVKGGQTWRNSN